MKIVENGIHLSSDANDYILDTDPNVQVGIKAFKQRKLGFMTHFGLFSQLGIVESWALSDEEDQGNWSQDKIDWVSLDQFKVQYFGLNKSFNPVRLDTDRLISYLKDSGFSYCIIPTKHHDGFCLWDTKQTEYNTLNTPYKKDVFNQFVSSSKKYDMPIGAYFSKPDWACKHYWDKQLPGYGTTRNPNYDIKQNPEKWEQFKQYTYNQLEEIVNYEGISCLWLDGGWVSTANGQDIEIEKIVKMYRDVNPSGLIADRTCGGKYENFITPEQDIPNTYLDVPWESCMSLGNSFAYEYSDTYKDQYQLSKMLLDVISKGGNLLLNIALQPDGRLPKEAIQTINKFSEWYKPLENMINLGKPIEPYHQGKYYYWNFEDSEYIFKLSKPQELYIKYDVIETHKKINKLYLINNGKRYETSFEQIGTKVKVVIPNELIDRESAVCKVYEIEE